MSTELVKTNTNGASGDERRALLRKTFAPNATDLEFEMFAGLCESTGLNPVRKEVWFIKTGDRCQIMTGINGFYAIANSHQQFDGIELDYGDEIKLPIKCSKQPELTHILVPEWIEAKVYRKDRSRPQTARAYWREYAQPVVTNYGNLSIWGQKPSIMLAKCAESMALRKAFPQELNGLYTQEEMPKEFEAKQTTAGPRDAELDDLESMLAKSAVRQRQNYLDQEPEMIANGEFTLQFGGTNRGKPLHLIDNGIFLKKHLDKYRDQYSEHAIKAIEGRLKELREEFRARKQAEDKMAQGGTHPVVTEGYQEGWEPSPEEIEAIQEEERRQAAKQ